jgi:glycosyltransferase involved in cell wall biosynthesis
MIYVMRLLPRLMRRLDRVLAISQSTRRDLENFAGVTPERISVVYNGVCGDRFHPRDKNTCQEDLAARLGIPSPFVLYISRLEHPGKNHVRLIEAFASLKRRSELPHKLVLAGSRWSGAEAIDAAVEQAGLQGQIHFTGFVDDADLPFLYCAADLFVFPSLYEGFGIPLVEAMLSGTPVCASDRASIPEVVGDAALLFDPEQPQQMAVSMERLLTDRALRDELVARGLRQGRLFDWDESATGVLRLCHLGAPRAVH